MITSKVYSDYVVFVQSKALRGRSKAEYLRQVRKLAERHPERSLKQLSERVVFDHLIHLRDEQKLRPSTLNQAVVALRLFYRDYLRRDWQLWEQDGFQQEETEENGGVISFSVVSVISCKNPDAPQGEKQFTLRTATRRLNFPGLFNNQFHSGLRRNETSGLGDTSLRLAHRKKNMKPLATHATAAETPRNV